MKRSARLIPVLLALLARNGGAQAPDPLRLADSLREEIDAGALSGDRARIMGARRLLDRATVLFPKDALLQHYKGYAIFRLLQSDPSGMAEETRSALLTEGLETFAASESLKPIAESYVLHWSLLGQTISDASSAMAVGPQMQQELADALRFGKDNPRVWLVQGQTAFFTPAMWGGGAEAALAHLAKAESLFAADKPGTAMPAWGRAEVHAWIGIAHQKLGHKDEAARAYQAALAAEPGYSWVRDVLVPGLAAGRQPFPNVP